MAGPFLIHNESDLRKIAEAPWAHYAMVADVALTSDWDPIPMWSGHFDGRGHIISNINIDARTRNMTRTSMFATINPDGAFHRTGFQIGSLGVRAKVGYGRCALLCEENYGLIHNCYFERDPGHTGGIIAQNDDSLLTLVAGVLHDTVGGALNWCWTNIPVVQEADRLTYKLQTVNFTLGEVLTGATSGATGTVTHISDAGANGFVNLYPHSVTRFVNNETVTGNMGGSAKADGASFEDFYKFGFCEGGGGQGGTVFYDMDTTTYHPSGTPPGPAPSIGKTTVQMKAAATYARNYNDFVIADGFDFTNFWTINEGVDYPRLRVV